MQSWLPKLSIIAAYFLVLVVGHRLDGAHIGLAGLVLALLVAHRQTRSFLSIFFPMLMYLLCYDLVHFLPAGWRQPVHVEELYRWESALFGLPHEFFSTHHWLAADLLAAVTYSLHFVAPIVFGFFLWRSNPRHVINQAHSAGEGGTQQALPVGGATRAPARTFAWAFLVLNIWALAIQLAFPTAPPWYVAKFGFAAADPLMSGDAGGLLRVDAWLGRPYFANMYGMSAIVFGAMPSMHGAWPILLLAFSSSFPNGVKAALVFYGVLMWFSAVYLQHHYMIDLLAGGVMAIASAAIARLILRTSPTTENSLHLCA